MDVKIESNRTSIAIRNGIEPYWHRGKNGNCSISADFGNHDSTRIYLTDEESKNLFNEMAKVYSPANPNPNALED